MDQDDDDIRLNNGSTKNNIDDEEPFDLDEILPAIGEFGKYQKLLLWFICLPACIPCGFCAFNQLFMADAPDGYWCRVPELDHLSVEERRSLAIPLIEQDGVLEYAKCARYKVDWSKMIKEASNNDSSPLQPDPTWLTEDCTDGWEYNLTTVYSSIVIDFDLVCEKDIYPTIGLSALNTGGPVGVYLFGLLNDRAGRRISYFSCLATLLLGSFLTAASQNFWQWTSARVIVGLTIPAVYQIPFIIALELVGPNYRSFVTVMTCTFYTFGIMMLSGVTYMVRDWVRLTLYTSTPFLLYFFYILIMPESPRWLLAKGRLEEALKILEVMARVNEKQFPSDFRDKLEERVRAEKLREKKKTKNIGALDLCKTPNMRLKTILITLNWFANETVYLGLSYYGPALGNDQYLSFFLSCLVEIPSYLACWVIMDKWGRRWPLCLLMIFGGISCIVTVLLPEDAITETLVLFLVSKTMISASFLIIYPFAGELYPTQVRGVGIGTSSYIGGLGMIVIPFITYLGKENLVLPLVIMGAVSVLGGFTGMRLPETLHQRLPQTLEDGEQFGADWTFDQCLMCPIRPTNSPATSYENLDRTHSDGILELNATRPLMENCETARGSRDETNEKTPLELARTQRQSMKRLVRQASYMETQKTDGTMQLTHWF